MKDETVAPDPAKALVDPQGKPAWKRREVDKRCPRCGASGDRRVRSGFGAPHDICGQCGLDFEEFTL